MSDPNEHVWHVFGNLPEGMNEPLNDGQIKALLERDVLTPDDVVRRSDGDDWVEIRETRMLRRSSSDGEERQQQRGGREQRQQQNERKQRQQRSSEGSHQQQSGGNPRQPSTSGSESENHSNRTDAGHESERIFKQLVQESWTRFEKHKKSTEVDEVLVGAVVTSTLENGYSLIDLDSDGRNHYLRFEDMETGHRTIFELDHRAESLTTAEIIGHEASVTIGYGERVRDFNSVWKALKQEAQGSYLQQPDPGVITVDGDMSSQYVYVQVRMLWDIDDYLKEGSNYEVRYKKMTRDVGATIDVLREYLEGRLDQTD